MRSFRLPAALVSLLTFAGVVVGCADGCAKPPDSACSAALGCSGDDPDASTRDATVADGAANQDASSIEPGSADSGNLDQPWVAPVLGTRSAGCGGAGVGTGSAGVARTTANSRAFRIVVPSNYDASRAYPVIMMFHGWQTNGTNFKSWFQFEKWVGNDGIVVYPDALGANGIWDVSGTTDLAFFDDMSAQIQREYCTNPARTFAFGFSYGGKFLNHLMCHRAGYVHAASIGDASQGDRGADARCGRIPLLETHRTLDNDELYAWGQENAKYWAQKNGCLSQQTDVLDPQYKCKAYTGCAAPGATTFCTDTEDFSSIDGYDPTWNHTVSERFRGLTWSWFQSFP